MDTPDFCTTRRFFVDLRIAVFTSHFLRAKELHPQKEANIMALYMVQGAYTAESLSTMAKNPQDRSVPVRELVQKLGGQLVGFYFCFGEYDVVALFELPDDSAATAIALAAVSPGHLKAYKTTKLFTVEETMQAMRKAGSLTFAGPSRG
jgi:uncharacterized protein with GYD domain